MRIAWESLFAYRESAARSSHALLRRERHQRGRTGPRPARLRCRVQALRQGDQGRSDQRGRVLRESRGGPGVPKVEPEEILGLYKKAIDLDGENPQFRDALASFCVDLGRFNDAEEQYNAAAKLDQEN